MTAETPTAPAAPPEPVQPIADSLSVNETIPPRSRTFSPEVVKRIHDYLTLGAPKVGEDGKPVTGDNGEPVREPVRNIAVGTFDKEGVARSALTTLNKLLAEYGHAHPYSGTVRQTEDGKFRAILLNKPAKKSERKKDAKPAPASGKKS